MLMGVQITAVGLLLAVIGGQSQYPGRANFRDNGREHFSSMSGAMRRTFGFAP